MQYINTIQQTPVNGGGFLFAMDENGTYLAHPEKRGSTDSHLFFSLKNNKELFTITPSGGSEHFVYAEYIPAKKIYIAASILKKDTMTLQKKFAAILIGLILLTPFIIFAISVYIARVIRKPLTRIIEVATFVSQGISAGLLPSPIM